MSQKYIPLPPLSYLFECFELDWDTGKIYWRERPREHFKTGNAWRSVNSRFAGTEAGAIKSDGYRTIGIDWRLYQAHRIVYAFDTFMDVGEMHIDHRNGDTHDNRPANLRLATHAENLQHRVGLPVNNTSGYRGVSWDKARGKYQAQFKHNGKRIYLGRFETAEEAHQVVSRKRQKIFGEFAGVGEIAKTGSHPGLHKVHADWDSCP